eukprot:TRINITY_DN3930_c0_g1_i2.p1 TRINITY_DN3930_c0_g1~~TRINITY_DN3930_c0_g1_i2.p1  ORF type:complete len:335 (+),score=123.66 TRINITY_DN3930_c0_g1_i2:84-1088(+)
MHAHFKKELPKLLAIERHSPLVTRVMGLNPGPFTLQGSNTYLIGRGASKILVDTGEGRPEYVAALRDHLAQEQHRLSHIILTHWHGDHVGGVAQLMEEEFARGSTVLKMPEPHHDPRVFSKIGFDRDVITPIADGDVFKTDGATLHAIHTPGHTKDHICLHLEEEHALVTGDIVLGTGSSHFSDLGAYMATLRRLLAVAKGQAAPCTVYPSHGPVVSDGAAKIEEYIDHRLARDEQIVAVLAQATQPQHAKDITAALYKDVPPHLHKAAQTNVTLHCLNLEALGRVARADAAPAAAALTSLGGGLEGADELSDIIQNVGPHLNAKWMLAPKSPL